MVFGVELPVVRVLGLAAHARFVDEENGTTSDCTKERHSFCSWPLLIPRGGSSAWRRVRLVTSVVALLSLFLGVALLTSQSQDGTSARRHASVPPSVPLPAPPGVPSSQQRPPPIAMPSPILPRDVPASSMRDQLQAEWLSEHVASPLPPQPPRTPSPPGAKGVEIGLSRELGHVPDVSASGTAQGQLGRRTRTRRRRRQRGRLSHRTELKLSFLQYYSCT